MLGLMGVLHIIEFATSHRLLLELVWVRMAERSGICSLNVARVITECYLASNNALHTTCEREHYRRISYYW